MASLRASIVLAAVVAAIPSASLWGQTPDSAAFHRRQWGVDFDIGNGFVGAGLIHFRNPTHALVLALSGSLETITSGGIGGENSSALNISLGARRYHPFAPRLYYYRTLGIEGSYAHSFTSGGPSTENRWMGGPFGELGAGWLVTPHLAVGAAWGLSAQYGYSKQTAGGATATSTVFVFSFGQVQLKGQLYF